MHLSQKRKIFYEFFFSFSKLRVNFEDFIKKITLTADVFLNLRSPKYVVREMSKRSAFRGLLNTHMLNGSKHCGNLNDSTFTIFIDPCEQIQGWKSLSD